MKIFFIYTKFVLKVKFFIILRIINFGKLKLKGLEFSKIYPIFSNFLQNIKLFRFLVHFLFTVKNKIYLVKHVLNIKLKLLAN